MTDFIEWLKKVFIGDQSSIPTYRPPPPELVTRKREPTTYRPSPDRHADRHRGIEFRDGDNKSGIVVDQDIKDLTDALTGASLRPELGLYQCQLCKVFYQTQSYELVEQKNGGSCVSCRQKGYIKKVAGHEKRKGRNVKVNTITLQNYHEHMGEVITFEGDVCKVLESRRGGDYAVMFEDRSWTRGFKMLVFRNDTPQVGGADFLRGLKGHHVRVRGLLVNEKFGDEIVVHDPSMILEVR